MSGSPATTASGAAPEREQDEQQGGARHAVVELERRHSLVVLDKVVVATDSD